MKVSFIDAQARSHQLASLILTSIQVKLEVLAEMDDCKPYLREKTNKDIDKLYAQYAEVMKNICESVIPEQSFGGVVFNREDMVTIAERFDFYPHDRGN